MNFPQYRKYKNAKSYFKVVSKEEFEEIKSQPGNKWVLTRHKASILPDRVFISDLLTNYHEFWEVISKEEYDDIKNKVK